MRSSLATRKKHDVEILLFREVNGTEQIVSDMLSGKFAATLIDASMVSFHVGLRNGQVGIIDTLSYG